MKKLTRTLLLVSLVMSVATAFAQQPQRRNGMRPNRGNRNATEHIYNAFYPGLEWYDNNQRHINAHGGGIIKHGDTYYWYGENRPQQGFTTEVGVEVYSSRDLMNWKDEGVALAVAPDGETTEPLKDIERGCIMERPKVVYNAKTGKFVMLFHLELKGRGYEAARVGFAISDTPTGPFTYLRSLRPNAGIWPFGMTKKDIKLAKQQNTADYKDWWTPEWRKAIEAGMFLNRDMEGGQMSRDMTVYIDEQGKAYHIFSSEDNLTLQLAELTDDYLDYTGKYIRIAAGGQNEAPTLFRHGGKYWLIASGCTGWDPNEARMFVADDIWGPWSQLPSPFKGAPAPWRNGSAKKSFGTQGTYILSVPQQDGQLRHIFMADIWYPRSLANSRHVWLPIEFDAEGKPELYWRDSWRLF